LERIVAHTLQLVECDPPLGGDSISAHARMVPRRA
jgi:hypothetical protein